MANYPNRNALRDAHDIYLEAMHPFITKNALDVIEGETDINDIAHIITKDWFDSFKQLFEDIDPYYEARSAAWQVVESRNRASHPPWDLDPEFTRTHLFLIANLLEKINRPDAKRKIEAIRDRLFSFEPEAHPAGVENADLKERLANRNDELKAEKEQHQDTQNKLAEMEGMEAEWFEMDERRKAVLKELTDTRAENAELRERLSERENRPKTVESESDEHIETLTDKTEWEKRYENTSIKEWRRKIWKQLCDYAAQKDTPVRFHTPGSENYLNVSRSLIDITSFKMNVWLGTDNTEIALRLYMSKQDFYNLEKQRTEIEQEFCESLEWEKLPQRIESRISLRKDIIDPTDESDWQNQHEWVISKLEKFHKKFNEVFLPRIQELNASDSLSEDSVFSNEVYTESQSYSESPAKSSKSQRKWRRPGAVAALRDPTEIQEVEAKIARILNPSEKSRLERELREAKRAVYGSTT